MPRSSTSSAWPSGKRKKPPNDMSRIHVDRRRKYPKATNEDQNPFAFSGFLPGYLRLLIFLRWTVYKCPHCGHVFRRDFWPRNVWLGSGERVCKNCGQIFDDGSREWRELPLLRKLRFFFPPLAIGIGGGFVVAAIASLFIGDEHSWPIVIIVSTFGLIPVLALSPIHLTQVIRSIHRYNARAESRS
jgi:hypothetical protein